MGRWDRFNKDSFDEKGFKTTLTDADIQKIRDHCVDMTESQKDQVVSAIVDAYKYIREMLEKKDDSPVEYNNILAMITLLYGEYESLTSPPAILVVCCQIARRNHFNSNTFKKLMGIVNRMLEERFRPDSSECFGVAKERKNFKFEL